METKTQAIVKVNPKEYGLTESKAKEIEATFKPMLDRMVELEQEYNQVAQLEVNEDTCKKAHELRLKYVKVRTGTAAIHKELKAFYLNGGRFVDGWKNAQIFASQGIEEKLSAIENHYENLEKERIAKLQERRAVAMSKYEVDYIPDNLGEMPDDVWNNFILGTRTNYEAHKEAERKAEEERQEQLRLDKRESARKEKILPYRSFWEGIIDAGTLRDLSDEVFDGAFEKIVAAKKAEEAKQEQVRKDNLRLQKEAEERERIRIAEEKKRNEQAEKERKAREEKERQERQVYAAKLQKEREERERAEAELRAKREAEEKARIDAEAKAKAEEAERKKAEKDARLAPDKKKLEKLASDLTEIQFPDVKSPEAFALIQKVKEQLDKLNQYIITESKKL